MDRLTGDSRREASAANEPRIVAKLRMERKGRGGKTVTAGEMRDRVRAILQGLGYTVNG